MMTITNAMMQESTGRGSDGSRVAQTIAGSRVRFSVLIILVAFLIAVGCNRRVVIPVQPNKNQTCIHCQSTRYGKPGKWVIDYQSPIFATCTHEWEDGITIGGMDDPVSDGTVVLLRKGDEYGAFIPIMQSGPMVTYKWYYRSDGLGTFNEADRAVQTGTSTGPPIAFGPFSLFWSDETYGSGWLYYTKVPGDQIDPSDERICVTDLKDVENLDARDAKWIYKASTIDPGIPGGPIESDSDSP